MNIRNLIKKNLRRTNQSKSATTNVIADLAELLYDQCIYNSKIILRGKANITLTISGDDLILVTTTEGGDKKYISYTDPTDSMITFNNDANTDIIIEGIVTKLDCSGESITKLDVSGCSSLVELNCEVNNIEDLDLRRCKNLQYLNCSSNELMTINLSNNTKLVELYCSDTELRSIDVSMCPELTTLDCNSNSELVVLDIMNTPKLTDLNLSSNPVLTTLQLNGTSAEAYQIVEEWLINEATETSGENKGQLYADENTPQSVKDAATAKMWEIV